MASTIVVDKLQATGGVVFTLPTADGSAGHLLKTNGSAVLSFTADTDTGILNVVEDTTPQLGGQLDVNGQAIGDGTLELLKFTETGSAVNEFTIANAASGSGPTISATGTDSNVGINITPKGTGVVTITSTMNPSISSTGKALVLSF